MAEIIAGDVYFSRPRRGEATLVQVFAVERGALRARVCSWTSPRDPTPRRLATAPWEAGFVRIVTSAWKKVRWSLIHRAPLTRAERALLERSTAVTRPGDLFLTPEENGAFGVIKVVAVERDGVHLRRFDKLYRRRPARLRTARLRSWLEHTPVATKDWAEVAREWAGRESVRKDELEGYTIWKEAGGGFFG